MLAIRIILYFSATLIIYPVWGMLDPATFSSQLTETFALAKDASETQIRQASAVFVLLNVAGYSEVFQMQLLCPFTRAHYCDLMSNQ